MNFSFFYITWRANEHLQSQLSNVVYWTSFSVYIAESTNSFGEVDTNDLNKQTIEALIPETNLVRSFLLILFLSGVA